MEFLLFHYGLVPENSRNGFCYYSHDAINQFRRYDALLKLNDCYDSFLDRY